MKTVKIFLYFLFAFSLYCCVPDEIILQGEIQGTVTDKDSRDPVSDVIVELNLLNATVGTDTTGLDGSYMIKHIPPDIYELQTIKPNFNSISENVEIEEASTLVKDLKIELLPYHVFSTGYLDFGFDSTRLSFTISNGGSGTLHYSVSSNQTWIDVEPGNGDVATEADTITVTIDRANLLYTKYEEEIYFNYNTSEGTKQATVDVFLNGLVDQDGNYYSIVTIGTQTWMQESLNTGVQVLSPSLQFDNTIIEKYCYDGIPDNCETYGGMYTWPETMDYSPADTGIIGTTQGICPDGWHIPTFKELKVLAEYLGGTEGIVWQGLMGFDIVGGRMKSSSSLWADPNIGDCDSGFEALPGGRFEWSAFLEGENVAFSTSELPVYIMGSLWDFIILSRHNSNKEDKFAYYLRCVKDPE